jgi:prepilin-type N-terminal cleavage/methylation domain-containing protein
MPSTNNKKFKMDKAFTLIELLVVIAIVGILAGLAVVSMSGATEAARIAKLKVYSNSIRSSLMGNRISEWRLDEGIGTTTADTVGTNNGTVVGVPAWKSGADCVSGKCLSFDGTDDYVSIGNFQKPSSFTIEAWVSFVSYSQKNYPGIVWSGDSSTAWGISANFANGKMYARVSDGSVMQGWVLDDLNSSNYPAGWHHLVFTGDGSMLKYYKDGRLFNSVAQTVSNSGMSSLSIGRWGSYSAAESYFNGLVDEVRVYSQSLADSGIRNEYLAGLDRLLASGKITREEYRQRSAELNSNYAIKK